ncbi:MAG TPA: hypothetical protein VGB16_04420 [candidate division Zixibacteria bacterium]
MDTPERESEIKKEIKHYMDENGNHYPYWYVGISEDPENRLFKDHGVKKNGQYAQWIYASAPDSETARRIEDYFVNSLATDGGTGGGDSKAKGVYAYRKYAHTTP